MKKFELLGREVTINQPGALHVYGMGLTCMPLLACFFSGVNEKSIASLSSAIAGDKSMAVLMSLLSPVTIKYKTEIFDLADPSQFDRVFSGEFLTKALPIAIESAKYLLSPFFSELVNATAGDQPASE
jgi:hypothetical protein